MGCADLELASEIRRQTAREHFDNRRWTALWQFQKTCKKGWDKLGFTPREIERIKINKPDFI
jgi:hypothetical protein